MKADVISIPTPFPWSEAPYATQQNLKVMEPTVWMVDSEADGPTEAQLDFFHKLGYSTAQVQAVVQKFGLNTDTDKVLGELVRGGAEPEASEGPVTTVAVVVPRGDAMQTPTQAVVLPAAVPTLHGREEWGEDGDVLRPIVIDGSNVAMSHGNKEVFSCLGIQLAVNFFLDRGHTEVTVFVPSWRKEQPRPDVPITDQHILRDLERKKIVVFTPSRRVAGKRVVCHDDRFIVKLAFESDGIVVSNDTYRDLQGENQEWKRFIEERLLMYSFVNNKFMLPDDPLGRHGPTLENFLRRVPKLPKKQLCPYGKKCTYGIKCKFHHPERANQSNRPLADELREKIKPPATGSAPPSAGFSLVEEMAQKLILEKSTSPSKKDHPSRSSKRSSSRKDKHSFSDHHGFVQLGSSSQEHLDSGLGSIDAQQMEAPWSHCDHQYASRGHSNHGPWPQYGRPHSTPCCHQPPGTHRGTKPGVQPHHHSWGPACSHSYDVMSYYHSYGAAPASAQAYDSHPHGRGPTRQQYFSDPYAAAHPQASGKLGKHSHSQWEPSAALQPPTPTLPPPPPPPGPQRKQREVVRKKLLAIFHASLVDMAMDMHPQLMDPQMLAAEILMLQSQRGGPR